MDAAQARDGKPISANVVTLLVTPPDAERIALAANEGSIMLTLRNPLDKDATQTPGIRTGALLGAPAPAPVVKSTGTGRRVVVTAGSARRRPRNSNARVETYPGG